MTFKYKNVYLNDVSTVVGPYEKNGPLGKYFDKSYDDLYFGEKTWENAESKLIVESVNILLKKVKKDKTDLILSGDLLNQIVSSSYAANILKFPYFGIFSACATSVEGLILASNMIDAKQINNCICTTSSHNNAAEKQFRYPIEYGGVKRKTTTFTCTGSASAYLSSEKSDIKIESATIGTVIDMGVKDAYYMGAVMSPACAYTINKHLKDMNRTVNDYDLILSGDLGYYGKKILKDYIKQEYDIELKNYEDTACILYDLKKQPVYSGASGPACAPLVTYSYILKKMKEKKYKRVLLVATGALMSTTMVNEKMSIPSIAHAISLEVI